MRCRSNSIYRDQRAAGRVAVHVHWRDILLDADIKFDIQRANVHDHGPGHRSTWHDVAFVPAPIAQVIHTLWPQGSASRAAFPRSAKVAILRHVRGAKRLRARGEWWEPGSKYETLAHFVRGALLAADVEGGHGADKAARVRALVTPDAIKSILDAP